MPFARLPRRLVRWSLALPALLAVASLALLVPSDERPRRPVGGGPTREPRESPDLLVLREGTLTGEVLREGPEHVVLRLPDGSVRLIPRADLVERRQVATPRTGPAVRVRLRSGRSVDARVLAETPEQLELRLEGGATITVRRSDIASVETR